MKIRTLAVLLALVAGTVGVTLYFVGANRTTAAASVAAADPIYAQLSSMTTQLPKDGPLMVQMENNDALGGLEHSDKTKTGDIVIKTPGVYFMVAAIQVAKEKGETDEYVDVWIKQNDKDVDNSGCRQQIKDTKFTTVLVSQGVAECKAGDKFNVMISSSSADKGLGIYATKPKGEATIPSIIFSVYKIN